MGDPRFSRIELMLGEEAAERLRSSFVVVVGLGAVGSYAVEGLARSGVGRLRLVDFDEVGVTNINRQLYALESTVGRYKCDVAAERVRDINPNCEVEPLRLFADPETMGRILAGRPDLVIDAIDSLGPKCGLIRSVTEAGIPLISSLGAALRTDFTRIRVGSIRDVHACPLGKEVRKKLNKMGASLDFECVYSDEPLPSPLPIAPPEKQTYERGRARNTLGSLPTLTGMFGLAAATRGIEILLGK
ncbi:MAG: tRNA threonylcarbamoyladenosine dehydratase [Abditibacteriota bacterium]|nr:tRNA threonylcarbamoyladenosine dehydratase [Abditibacteriota bacterium]